MNFYKQKTARFFRSSIPAFVFQRFTQAILVETALIHVLLNTKRSTQPRDLFKKRSKLVSNVEMKQEEVHRWGNGNGPQFTCIFALLTSMYSQLSVVKAIVNSATAMIEVIVARLNVTAEQGIFPGFFRNLVEWFEQTQFLAPIF